MYNTASTSKQNATLFEDDEVFEDSAILANFNYSSFKERTSKFSENNLNESGNKSTLNVSALCCDEEISGYDKLTGQTWIYPTNYPVRDYQFNIIKAAILKNTLVSLPTGLGKTFIAAVIMYNFYRWYPLGKIVFTAPTRPLVAQQIEACYDIIAIPPNDTIEMTGHMQVNTRKAHWLSKRVFFATPQVIYNDIKSGICPADKIRCLVIDEAHRARGNYAYCQIMGTLTDMGHKTFRVLALSATPGSKVEDVVNVVKNLHIAHLELRTENCIDVAPYSHSRSINTVVVQLGPELSQLRQQYVEVVKNLHIAHLGLRTENCIDVAPYSHSRSINTVVVQLGPELSQLRQQYVEIIDGYARRLKQLNILPHNLGNLSKGRVVMLYKEFQSRERGARHPQHNYIMKDFTILIALYHGLELLVKHGSRVFLNFFDEHPEKTWIQSDNDLTGLLERLRDDLGVNPLDLNRSILPDGTVPEIPKNLCFGHPKFYKLKEIMLEHFNTAKQNKQDTRAIVFCEYRESVNLVHCLLLQCRPLITAQMFVGQGASGKEGKAVVSQKQQLRVMRNFREGVCNTLVATCVAEEGLDVGSVDLILCFDISTRSPIRLVQRCGRTGRERGGKVYILVTEGREQQTLLDCIRQRDGLNKKILQSCEVQSSLYGRNPRMVPHDFVPQCQKMYITVQKKTDEKTSDRSRGVNEKSSKKGQKDLRSMFLGGPSTSSSPQARKDNIEADTFITEQEFNELFPEGFKATEYFEKPKELWSMSRDNINKHNKSEETGYMKLSTWLEWQRNLQKTINIDHSRDTEILASLLQYSDAKRFEMHVCTQNPSFNTQDFASQKIAPVSPKKVASPVKTKPQKKKPKPPMTKLPGKNDGDIRALFSTATKSTKSYTKLINDLGVQNDGSVPTKLINLLVDLTLDNTNSVSTCYICKNICDCTLIKRMKKTNKTPALLTFLKEPKLPDLDLIDDIDAETILKCYKTSDKSVYMESQDIEKEFVNYLDVDKKNISNNFDLEFDFESPIDLTSPEKQAEDENTEVNSEKNFDIGDIEDIFAESSPEENLKVETTDVKDKNSSDPKETLGFFGLDSIDDIFADTDADESNLNQTTKTEAQISNIVDKEHQIDDRKSDKVMTKENPKPLSPSILSGKPANIPSSPILCSQVRKFKLSTKKKQPQSSTPTNNVKRCLIPEVSNNSNIFATPADKVQNTRSALQRSLPNTSNKSMFTITQLVDMINKTDDEKLLSVTSKEKERSTSPILLTQADRKKIGNISNRSKVFETPPKKCESLIILESDSDSDNNTQVYDLDENVNVKEVDSSKSPAKGKLDSQTFTEPFITSPFGSPTRSKRKLQDEDNDVITNSPFFNKKRKLSHDETKPKLSLQEKVLMALKSNKINNNKEMSVNKDNFDKNRDMTVNLALSPRKSMSQKENKAPGTLTKEHNTCDEEKEYIRKSNLEMLQMFRRGSKVDSPREKSNVDSPKEKFTSLLNGTRQNKVSRNRKLTFDDSDDDFVDSNHISQKPVNSVHKNDATANHKVRKKRKRGKDFLELEAELSSDADDSGDELSDESAGSIIDFICDENVSHHEDMQAHYLESIKSPVKGVFKIPQLPKKYDNMAVLSQFVEEDNYEMDSFCVDSHIGLTQINDVSELEVAEMLLEQKKAKKKKLKPRRNVTQNGDSPIVRRKNRNVQRIHSDSDDSS